MSNGTRPPDCRTRVRRSAASDLNRKVRRRHWLAGRHAGRRQIIVQRQRLRRLVVRRRDAGELDQEETVTAYVAGHMLRRKRQRAKVYIRFPEE